MTDRTIPSTIPTPNLIGQKFTRLTVIAYDGMKRRDPGKPGNASFWLCRCDCGAEKSIPGFNLKKGNTRSCGCLLREASVRNGKKAATHNSTASPEYNARHSLLGRCLNPNDPTYHKYGGRGITVCQRWQESFENFLEDMGRRPSDKHSIDRINNDGGYHCGKCNDCHARGVLETNCRWATRKTQCRNRSTSLRITYNGETRTLVEWAEILGIPRSTLSDRLGRRTRHEPWDIERAFTSPVMSSADVHLTLVRDDVGKFIHSAEISTHAHSASSPTLVAERSHTHIAAGDPSVH